MLPYAYIRNLRLNLEKKEIRFFSFPKTRKVREKNGLSNEKTSVIGAYHLIKSKISIIPEVGTQIQKE